MNPEAYYDTRTDLDLPDRRRRAQLVADVVQSRDGLRVHSGSYMPFTYAGDAELEAGRTGYARPAATPKPIGGPVDRAAHGRRNARRLCRPGIR